MQKFLKLQIIFFKKEQLFSIFSIANSLRCAIFQTITSNAVYFMYFDFSPSTRFQ